MHLYIPKSILRILAVAILFISFAGYNFIRANDESVWFPPAGPPPSSNVAAPINQARVSTDFQIGHGNVSFDQFTAFNRMNANRYCDLGGKNCFSGSDITPLPICADGKTLIAKAGNWICGDPGLAPAPVSWLVNKQHSEAQCRSLKGEVVTEDGKNFCRFSGGSDPYNVRCPVGWVQYDGWGVYGKPYLPGTTYSYHCDSVRGTEDTWTTNVPSGYYTKTLGNEGDHGGSGESDEHTYSCNVSVYAIGCY